MEGPRDHIYQEMGFKKNGVCVQWVIMEAQSDALETESMESIGEDSGNNSAASTSSSEVEEDDASSSSPKSSSGFGPLYELSDLMSQLPIKRGLSKHYQGKSQSFTSLANAKSVEDLAKKVGPSYSQRMKSCKSYAGFDGHKFGPKATIAKKPVRGSSFASLIGSKANNLVGSFRHPISLQRDC